MNFHFLTALSITLAALSTTAAYANPATPDQAAAIQRAIAPYVGQDAIDAGFLSIAPKADGYNITIDFNKALASLRKSGFAINASPWIGTLTPLPNGQWAIDLASGSKTVTSFEPNGLGGAGQIFTTEGQNSRFVFDPALMGLTSWVVDIKTMKRASPYSDGDAPDGSLMNASVTHLSNDVHSAMTGTAKTPDSLTANIHETIGKEFFKIDKGQRTIQMVTDSSVSDVVIDGARNRAMLKLLSWLVAHPTTEDRTASRAEEKLLLGGLLPLFDNVATTSIRKNVAIETSDLKAAIDEIDSATNLNGVDAPGSLTEKISFKGISVNSDTIPSWKLPTLPSDVALTIKLSDYDLSKVARTLISNIDFDSSKPISDEIINTLYSQLFPKGEMTVDLTDIHIGAPIYDLTADVHFKMIDLLKATGDATIHLKGLNAIQEAMQQAAQARDPQAQPALIGLAMIRGFGETEADGGSTWNLHLAANGDISVNGTVVRYGHP